MFDPSATSAATAPQETADRLQGWIDRGLVLLAATTPLLFDLQHFIPAARAHPLNFSPFDALLLPLAALVFWRVARDYRREKKLPPLCLWTALLMGVVFITSIMPPAGKSAGTWLKDAAGKGLAFFVLTPLVVLWGVKSRDVARRMVWAALAAFSPGVLLALYQYLAGPSAPYPTSWEGGAHGQYIPWTNSPASLASLAGLAFSLAAGAVLLPAAESWKKPLRLAAALLTMAGLAFAVMHGASAPGFSDYRIGGFYDNRNLYGAALCVFLPAAVAAALWAKRRAARLWCVLLVALALGTTTSGFALLAVLAGIAVVCALSGGWRGILGAAGTVAALGAALWVLPVFSPQPWGWVSHPAEPSILPSLGRNAAALLNSLQVYRYVPSDDVYSPAKRLRRWQANLNAIRLKPLWGWGAGQYNLALAGRYHPHFYPHGEGKTNEESLFDTEADEPYTFGMWWVNTCEFGLVGLLVLLFFFAEALACGIRAAFSTDATGKWLGLCAVGATVAAAVYGPFGNVFVRGLGGGFILLVSLAAWFCVHGEATQRRGNSPQMDANIHR